MKHYLNDEPASARPPSAAYRFRKFARRNKTKLSIAALATILIQIGVGAATLQAVRAMRAERIARAALERTLIAEEQQRKLSFSVAERLRHQLYVSDMSVAENAWRMATLEP